MLLPHHFHGGKNYIIPAQKIDTLTIDVKDKKITIQQSKDEQIHIVYYESEKDLQD